MKLAIVGLNASGKDSVADYLKTKGFEAYTLSDVTREELRKRGLEISRPLLIQVSNELREKYGNDFLARKCWEKTQSTDVAFVSIRNPDEVRFFKEKGCVILEVSTTDWTRFERSRLRQREGEAATFEEFQRIQKQEMENPNNPSAQQLKKVLGMAGERIENNGSIEELHRKVDALLEKFGTAK